MTCSTETGNGRAVQSVDAFVASQFVNFGGGTEGGDAVFEVGNAAVALGGGNGVG